MRHTRPLSIDRPPRDTWLYLLFLTLVAGILRFWALDRPILWGDEAATFARVCGTYAQMLVALQDQGFGPLHYQLYWWIGQGFPLSESNALTDRVRFTEQVMRFVPALAGTLMVPAVFFLAVQLVRVRVALLAAAIAATSAYLLVYSRDAKMYSHTWLFMTLHVACLFWWLRSRNFTAWLGWLAAGVAMTGLQLATLLVLPVEIIALLIVPQGRWHNLLRLPLFLTFPLALWRGRVSRTVAWVFEGFRWPPVLAMVIGFAIMGIGPYVNATYNQKFFEEVVTDAGTVNPVRGGIGWVERFNDGRTGFDLIAYTATAYLTGWEWPQEDLMRTVDLRTQRALKAAVLTLTVLLATGLVPWRRRTRPEIRNWRAVLLLGVWLVIPPYIVFLFSGGSPVHRSRENPWQVLTDLFLQDGQFNRLLVGVVLAVILTSIILCGRGLRQRLQRTLALAVPALAVFGLAWLIWWQMPQVNKQSVWMPRYVGAVWPAFAIVLAILITRLPTPPLRWGTLALFILVNLGQFGARLYAFTEPPTDIIAADLVVAEKTPYVRVVMGMHGPRSGGPGTGLPWTHAMRQYVALNADLEVTPPMMWRTRQVDRRFAPFGGNDIHPGRVFDTLRKAASDKKIRQIILWEANWPENHLPVDNLSAILPGWTAVTDDRYMVHVHWTWEHLLNLRRRVLLRQ